MTAPREQVLATIKARLAGIAGVASVYRMRTAAIPVESYPALVLLDGDQSTEERETLTRQYRMLATVVALVGAPDDDALGPAVSALYVEIVRAVIPAGDATLGLGFVSHVREAAMEGPAAGEVQGKGPTAIFTVDFEIDFATAPEDPGAAP